MSDLFKMLIMMGTALSVSVAQAAGPVCSTGSLAYIEGEINNNTIGVPPSPLITLGVAEIQVFQKKGPSMKFTCALHGIPASGDHNYDHRLVCNDNAQSEISFDTRFTGSAPLNPRLERKLCRGSAVQYFQEKSVPDAGEPSKGKFSGVSEGEISVNGCVNITADTPPDLHINMLIDGYLCLQNSLD